MFQRNSTSTSKTPESYNQSSQLFKFVFPFKFFLGFILRRSKSQSSSRILPPPTCSRTQPSGSSSTRTARIRVPVHVPYTITIGRVEKVPSSNPQTGTHSHRSRITPGPGYLPTCVARNRTHSRWFDGADPLPLCMLRATWSWRWRQRRS